MLLTSLSKGKGRIPVDMHAGVWIDHRKAVIVIVTKEGEEIYKIDSNMEKHIRFKSGSGSTGRRSTWSSSDAASRWNSNTAPAIRRLT